MLSVVAVLTGFLVALNLTLFVAAARRRRAVEMEQEHRERTVAVMREAAIREFRERQSIAG